MAAASRSSPTGSASSRVCFSTAPVDSTATTSAMVGEMPTSWTERRLVSPVAGPTTTPGVGGEVAEQPGRVLQHLLELAVGLLEERAHLHGVLPAEAGRLPEVVDEEAVALLGGDPAGAGVGLAEVALLLEGGHVVAHRGRRHRHRGRLHDVRRPHRLGGVDVLLHDGPEDGGLAFVEHARSWHSMLPSASRPQQVSAVGPAWQPGRMRFVVVGAGAVGGVVGGRLAQHGHDVVLVARGDHGQAIAADGLLIRSPDDEVRVSVPVVSHPSELTLTDDDVVLLAVKGQDTAAALEGLAAGPPDLAIACLQNGVDNERQVLRRTPNTYARAGDAPGHLPRARRGRGVVGADHAGSSTSAATRRGIDERAEAISDRVRHLHASARCPSPT